MNEDQKEAINIALQQALLTTDITDIRANEKGGVSVTYDDGKTIDLNTSLLDNVNPAAFSAAATAINASASYINGYYKDNSITGIKYDHYPWLDSNITTSTGWTYSYTTPAPVCKKYFIEDKFNFSWIIAKFMKTYVSNLNNTSSSETISFFGLKNGEEKTLSLTLKAIDTSVKEFFDLAVTTAKQNSFDELFGPLTDELSEEDYIVRVEDSGVFIKELYDEKSIIELVKSHKIEISKKINHKNKQRALTGVLEDDDDEDGWFSKAPWDTTLPKTEIPDNDAPSLFRPDLWRDPRTFLVQADHVKYGSSSISSNISNISSVTQGTSASSGSCQYKIKS